MPSEPTHIPRVSSRLDVMVGTVISKRSGRVKDVKGNTGGATSSEGVTRITAAERDPIAAALRQMYDDAAQEPLPDELTRLLDQLGAAEKNA